MKTYEIKLRRTSFIVVTVEAEDEADAEALAWQESMPFHSNYDSSWDIESIEEVAPREAVKTWQDSIEEVNNERESNEEQ